MRVLVTGADGYIGVVLVSYLLERGHDVVGLDTGYYRDGWLFDGDVVRRPYVVRDVRAIADDDLRGFDAIAHLAELSNDPLGQHSPEITYEINHRGTVALAARCRRLGIRRFVYTSSCSAYGIAEGEALVTEEAPTNPQTAYARCKLLVERDVGAMAGDDFSPTFLRNATAYGPSPRMRFDIVLNNLAGLAWTTGEIRMVSDGTPWRPLVHVRDICQAIACALEAPREIVHNQIFNVGDTTANYRIREIAEAVGDGIPGCRISFGDRGADNRSYRVSFEKINRRLPGFHCRYDIHDGVRQLADVFGKIGMTREVFEFRAYTRLRQLEHLLHTEQIDARFFWRDPRHAAAAPVPGADAASSIAKAS